ncbi:hypothetical protein BG36_09000 [Aquamicrobium defluvii]|uniref:DUF3800 domain-containing protein n=2 Tax=Aquamicrobium defluvii TaxID=69279 RepID=A0A011TLN6_9HYPH|nr:hypothetical protein BG36_09000 [Aquamicrobium defluvii]EZQ14626.1 hypothetical protein CF98_19090 [Halopseudomonas bauzanensis]
MYRLFLDEVGVEVVKRLHRDNFRYLSLTGVVMKLSHARDYLEPAFDRIKADIFDQDPDDPICFHRTDIRGRKGPFECLKHESNRDEFDRRILQVMSDAEYRVITVFIDKQWMVAQAHWEQTHPYHYLMEIMVEKYAQFLRRMSSIGDIMPEARGNAQDQALQAEFDRCQRSGTRYVDAREICQRIKAPSLKFRTKKNNSAGLQLCDLVAHPSHFTIRQNLKHEVNLGPFCERVSEILVRQKYDRSYNGDVRGYGFKHLP